MLKYAQKVENMQIYVVRNPTKLVDEIEFSAILILQKISEHSTI